MIELMAFDIKQSIREDAFIDTDRVSGLTACVYGVYENRDVFVKRYTDVLERPRKY